MSRNSMVAALGAFGRAPIYGVASCLIGRELVEFEIGWDEFERDVQWAATVLESIGLRSGDIALTMMQTWESPWIGPFIQALRQAGVTYVPVEPEEWDAQRTAMFLQRLSCRLVLGLSAATVHGLERLELDAAELFDKVDVVWARPGAAQALRGARPEVLGFVPLGPTVAVGLPGRAGVVVNAAEWHVETVDGEFVLSNAQPRRARFDRLHTGVYGSLSDAADGAVTLDIVATT